MVCILNSFFVGSFIFFPSDYKMTKLLDEKLSYPSVINGPWLKTGVINPECFPRSSIHTEIMSSFYTQLHFVNYNIFVDAHGDVGIFCSM